MKKMEFSIEIHAAKEKVWETLWQDATFREWAGIIDPETYMLGDLKEGNEVEFISGANGYGVTSLVEKLIPNELLLLKHSADTQESGKKERKEEWTGGTERYSLEAKNDVTTLSVTFDVPSEMEAYFKSAYPKALDRVKVLAEEKA